MTEYSDQQLIDSLEHAIAASEGEEASWADDLPELPAVPTGEQRMAIMIPNRQGSEPPEERAVVRGPLRRISILRGGKGSGHFSHEGRPGEVGGSQPQSGSAGQQAGAAAEGQPPPERKETEPPPLKAEPGDEGGALLKKIGDEEVRFESEEQYQQIKALAEDRFSKAREQEGAYTELMEQLASEHGGQLVGLEHSLKSADGLTRKIRMDMIEKGLTEEEAAQQITDANRYTMTFGADEFVAKAQEVQASLSKQGWTMYDHKWKNYFQSGDAYDGYNTVMENKDTGQLFELQFHTPQSVQIKKQARHLFERFRVLGADQQHERRSLWQQMTDLWNRQDYRRPANWWTLQGVMK